MGKQYLYHLLNADLQTIRKFHANLGSSFLNSTLTLQELCNVQLYLTSEHETIDKCHGLCWGVKVMKYNVDILTDDLLCAVLNLNNWLEECRPVCPWMMLLIESLSSISRYDRQFHTFLVKRSKRNVQAILPFCSQKLIRWCEVVREN